MIYQTEVYDCRAVNPDLYPDDPDSPVIPAKAGIQKLANIVGSTRMPNSRAVRAIYPPALIATSTIKARCPRERDKGRGER